MACSEGRCGDDASVLCDAQDVSQQQFDTSGLSRKRMENSDQHDLQRGPEGTAVDLVPPSGSAEKGMSTLFSREKLRRIDPMGFVDILKDILCGTSPEGNPLPSSHAVSLYKRQESARPCADCQLLLTHSNPPDAAPTRLCWPRSCSDPSRDVCLGTDVPLCALLCVEGWQADVMGEEADTWMVEREALLPTPGSISPNPPNSQAPGPAGPSPKCTTNLVCLESLPHTLMTAGPTGPSHAMYDSLSLQWFDSAPRDERFDLVLAHKDIQTANAYLSKAKLPGRGPGNDVQYSPVSPELVLCEFGLKWNFSGSAICLAHSYLLRLNIKAGCMQGKDSDVEALCVCLSLASQVCDPSCINQLVKMLQLTQKRDVGTEEACCLLFRYCFLLDFRLGPYFTIKCDETGGVSTPSHLTG